MIQLQGTVTCDSIRKGSMCQAAAQITIQFDFHGEHATRLPEGWVQYSYFDFEAGDESVPRYFCPECARERNLKA